MSTPFTTRSGLRIGRYHTPAAPAVAMDADALRLQRALLGDKQRTDWDGIAIVLGTLAVIGLTAWVTA